MLIEFNVENFRSIKDKVTLSLLASPDKTLDNNLIESGALKKGDKLLKSTVIYGANASGKSNLLKAFNILQYLVMSSNKNMPGDKIPFTPFKLDPKYSSKPTRLEISFIENNIQYTYGVSFTDEKIIDEYLYYYPKGRKAIIFERTNTSEYRFSVERKVQNSIKERTADNVLYLSNSVQQNYDKTREAFNWFKEKLRVVGPTSLLDDKFTIELLNSSSQSKNYILKAIYEADLGIKDVNAGIKKVKAEELPPDFPDELKRLFCDKEGYFEEVDIKTMHKVTDENGNYRDIVFNFDDESEGTRKMFCLIGPWIDTLINGRILIIDELDTKLHYFLNAFLIKVFQDPTQNKNNAQLIFTTHNTNLLDQELFRRDQIWFTEKNFELGRTDLYSLVDFSPRKDKNIQKGYLAGRYGAIPFISEERIF